MECDRDELIEMVAFALWRHRHLWRARAGLSDARIWARQVVEHLEQSGVVWRRQLPPPPHGTP